MNIFRKIRNLKYELEIKQNQIENLHREIGEYKNLISRFVSIAGIGLYSPDNSRYGFEDHIRGLEERAAKDAERDKIRDYIKEIQAEAAHEDKRPS